MLHFNMKPIYDQAIKHGAVKTRTFKVVHHQVSYNFSVHFFDLNDEEIGYFIIDTYELLGATWFDTPRIWSEEFKINPNYETNTHLGL